MFQRVLVSVAIGMVGLVSSCAQAAEPRFEFTPFIVQRGGGGFLDANNNDVNLTSKSGVAVAIDWATTEHREQYELLYSSQHTKTDGATPIDMKIEYLQLGGTTIIGDEESHVVPFAAGGVGAARFSPGLASLTQETRLAFSLGGGIRIPLAQHVRLRFEARGYLTWLNGSSSLFCNSDGVSTAAPCALQARGQTLFQYEALGGVSIGF